MTFIKVGGNRIRSLFLRTEYLGFYWHFRSIGTWVSSSIWYLPIGICYWLKINFGKIWLFHGKPSNIVINYRWESCQLNNGNSTGSYFVKMWPMALSQPWYVHDVIFGLVIEQLLILRPSRTGQLIWQKFSTVPIMLSVRDIHLSAGKLIVRNTVMIWGLFWLSRK